MVLLNKRTTRLRLTRRLERASYGNLGDVKPIGGDIYEMGEFFGCGWRMYCIVKSNMLIVMLCGGDKFSQQTDIEKARKITATWKEE